MKKVVEKALNEWGLERAEFRLVAARENAVYEVSTGRQKYALRLHRQGYRSDSELRSELDWMAEVERGGISVPAPVPTHTGEVLCHIDGIQVDVLTWLSGQTMADVFADLEPKNRYRLFFDLGQQMAKLHQSSDAWIKPPDFDRAHWDHEGLLGDTPLWDSFWENPNLVDADRELFEKFRHQASVELQQVESSLDYGLIHADLVPNNVLVDGGTLKLIDFDDGGFGYRLFDIATVLAKHKSEPDYPELHENLMDGYRLIRPLDITHLDLFLALRAATYVGWNITRMDEPDGVSRNERFIQTLRRLAVEFLDGQNGV